jgi:predicted MPP superfamily phosphohydrolase
MTASNPPLSDLVTAARRFLFSRLFRNLAGGLGLMQALVAHWVAVLVGAPSASSALPWLLLALVLAAANVALVPPLMRRRGRSDAMSRALRRYVELGVATLLLGTAVAACWLVLAPVVALPYLLGLYDYATAAWLFRTASGAFVGLVAFSVAWSLTAGQARVAYTRVRVELPGLEQRLAGLRVVQISDLHIGNQLEGERLARMVARVNETDPDLVAITGDLFHDDPRHLPEARHLNALRARHGVFAILGNHDANVGADRVADALAEHAPGVRLLRDELVRLPLPAPLYVAGVEDPGGRWFERRLRYRVLETLRARWPGDGPLLLLAHQPEVFEHAADLGYPLVLAGHTHGGQLALPLPGGHWNLARVMTPLTRGVFQRGSCTMYVNRGLGVGGPAMRFHCSREIATIELAAKRLERSLEELDEAGDATLLVRV